jgi:very-short-patch-repair endonuclease
MFQLCHVGGGFCAGGALAIVGEIDRLEVKIAQIAAEQQGNITRPQLIGLGMSSTSITRWVRIGRLFRVYDGVYSVGRPPTTPLERASAAVLACGERAALSHGSAMTLWGFWKRWDEPFDVSVAGDRRPKGIRTRRVTGLLQRDVCVHQGIRVTSPARTLLDMAPQLPPKSLRRYINDSRRSELITLDALADVVRRFPLHPGAPLLREHLQNPNGPTRSEFEDAFVPFCDRFRLPVPKINTTVAGFEVDAYFEAERLIVELDGWDFHNDRAAFEGDRDRDATMLALGIVTVRITWERLKGEPEKEAERLLRIIEMRRAAAA